MKVSRESVRLILRDNGLIPHRQVPKPKLTEEHMARRLAFAQQYLHRDWRLTIFTDEKHFTLHSPPNRKNDVVWDEAGTEYIYEKGPHSAQVRVWGGFSATGKTKLVRYIDTLNSERYIRIIKGQVATIRSMFGADAFMFQQDGAPCHTSSTTLSFLQQTFGQPFDKKQWPANSPDLNPIENLWAIVEDKIRSRNPKTLRSLKRMITEEWNAIYDSTLENLVKSMPSRLRQCIERNGGWTDY